MRTHYGYLALCFSILTGPAALAGWSTGYNTPILFAEGDEVNFRTDSETGDSIVEFGGIPAELVHQQLTAVDADANGDKLGRDIKCSKQDGTGKCSLTLSRSGALEDAPMDADFDYDRSQGEIQVVHVIDSPYGGLNVRITGTAAKKIYRALRVPSEGGLYKKGEHVTCMQERKGMVCLLTFARDGRVASETMVGSEK